MIGLLCGSHPGFIHLHVSAIHAGLKEKESQLLQMEDIVRSAGIDVRNSEDV